MDKYTSRGPTYNALREEVVFILQEAITAEKVKVHSIESRVKSFDSLKQKFESSSLERWTDVVDIVGARVICLFKSDLAKIDAIISKEFTIKKKDDKISSSEDSFGYMSIHYECLMHSAYSGPRYSKVKGIKFEVQVRTLCMHAWAAISHYLDYKAQWDIPDNLKKGLNALSGLFYVADEQYETLYNARIASQKRANTRVRNNPEKPQELNLDTFQAFLKRRYPDRKVAPAAISSAILGVVVAAGYQTFEELETDLDDGSEAFLAYENKIMTKKGLKEPYFSSAAVVRITLQRVNSRFAELDQR